MSRPNEPFFIEAAPSNGGVIGRAIARTLDEAIGCIKAFMSIPGFGALSVTRDPHAAGPSPASPWYQRGPENDEEEEEEVIDSDEVKRRVQGYRRTRDDEEEDEDDGPLMTAEGGPFGDGTGGQDDDDEEDDDEEEEDEEEEEESEAKGPPPPPPIARPKKVAKRMAEPIPPVADESPESEPKVPEETPKNVPQTFAEADQQVRESFSLNNLSHTHVSMYQQEQLAKSVADEERKQVSIDIQEAVVDKPRPVQRKKAKKQAASTPVVPLKPILKKPIPPPLASVDKPKPKQSVAAKKKTAQAPISDNISAERTAKLKKLREEYDALVKNPNEDPSFAQRRSTLLLIRDTVMEQMESAIVGSDEYNRYSRGVDNVMQMLQALPSI
jgi:hypothetical protein